MKLFSPSKLTSALIARKGHAVPSNFGMLAPSRYTGEPVIPNHAPKNGSRSAGFIAAPAKESKRQAERARVSLRLNQERHLRLRLTAAHMQTTLQDILTEALDNYLNQISPEVIRDNCLCLRSGSRSPKQ